MIGSKLAHYEITSHLGSGGMGDVYQATDSKLGRSVAVKFLPDAFVFDLDRVARFEREARVLASLNHPNIAAIYGLEEANEKKFLVMELIAGETLSERIARGPIPIEEALAIANQIGKALEAAHEQGIVHRDLKPANIKITADDRVKVLDFGLAKASQQDTGSAIFSHSPTMMSVGGTNAGMILGTAAYMSPEQARGKKVDQRADIWAFGVVFYEMLTGQSLFKGDDLTEILASVVKDKPDLNLAPRRVRRLLEACLEKDPGKRLQSIGDMRLLIESGDAAEALAPAAVAPSRIGKFGWLLAAGAILAAGAFWAPWRKPEPPEMVRFQIGAPPKTVFTNWMSISPDGRKVGFTARGEDGQVKLWVRPIDALEAKPIANTSANPLPFWSQDSRWIGYQLEGKLRKVEAAGGPSQVLSDAPGSFGGGTFSPDGSTIVFGGQTDVLMKVSSSGGVPVAITKLDLARQETGHYMPVFLTDGKHFLYHRQSSNQDNSGTFIGSLDDNPDAPRSARLIGESFNSIYAPAAAAGVGYVLFRRERTLLAQPFDPSKLALTGEPILVADPVGNMASLFLNAAVSARTLIVRETGLAELRQLIWVDRNGARALDPVTEPANWNGVALSVDGSQAAAYRADEQGNFDIYTIDMARRLPTRLTFDRAADFNPIWSPDRMRIVFTSEREGGRNLFLKAANGATQDEVLFRSSDQKTAEDWSRDGKFVLFSSLGKSKGDIWTLDMTSPEHKATLYVGTNADEQQARFSPDGRFVIYRSDESGSQEIYMRTFPDTGGKWQISNGGGTNPRWSRDGKEVYFSSGGANIMAVKVSTASTVQLSNPVKLFTGFDGGSYDVASDGRFLMAVTSGQNSVNPITVTLHWQAALKK